jgi:uncharacterized membrane protein
MLSGRLVFRPLSVVYYVLLLLLLLILLPYFTLFFREIMVKGLGLPPEALGGFLLLSLVGSFFNIPLTEVASTIPIYAIESIGFFGVTWRIPRLEIGVRKTLVTLNVGGALVPLIFSFYLLGWSIPSCSSNTLLTYTNVLIVLAVVTLVVHRSSRLVKGLGIATPAFIPPTVVALTTLLVDWFIPLSCPTQIAYVGGTIGTLIGADLLNINKIAGLGAPVVSIGGAGTFDGVYTTGLISVLLVLLLL